MRRTALVLAVSTTASVAFAVTTHQRETLFAGRSLVYVSNAAANNIPAGSDLRGAGSRNSPVATIEKAISKVRPGGRILCNDGTYTPPVRWDITKSITIDAVTVRGCVLRSQTGQAAAFQVGGGVFKLGAVDVDLHNNASYGIGISDGATTVLQMDGTYILNPVDYGVYGTGSATKIRATLNNVHWTGVTTKSPFYLPTMEFGDISIDSPNIAISGNAPAANQGLIHVSATAAGSRFSVTNLSIAATTTSALSAYFRGVLVENIPNAKISGGTISITAASANVNCDGADVSFNPSIPLDSSGAIVENLTVTHDCGGGGHGVTTGIDGDPGVSLRNYVNGAIIRNNHVTGTAASQASGLHGMLCGWQTGCTVYRNSMDMTSLGYVIKGMAGATVYSNLATRTTGKSFYQKGGSAVKFIHNTDYEAAAGPYRPFAFYAGDDGSTTGPATGMIVKGNVVDHEDATSSGTFIFVETGSTATATYNDYYAVHPRTFPWVYTGTDYATLAAWQAAKEATGVGNKPSLNTTSANLPLLVQSSIVSRVPADSDALVDYVGNSFRSPAATGANETTYVAKDVADFTVVTSLPTGLANTHASTSSYIDGSGYVATAAINAIRITHDPVTPYTQRGWLLEPAGTNLFLQSQFAASWSAVNGTLAGTSNTGPDNVASSAKSFIEDATASAVHGLNQTVAVVSGTTYTISVFGKPIGANGWLQIRLPAGQFGATTVANYQLSGSCAIGTIGANATGSGCLAMANGYYREWISAPATATGSAQIIYYTEAANNTPTHNGDGVSGTFLWGAQAEARTEPSSYIATTTATATRAADAPTLTGTWLADEAAGPSSMFITNPNTGASADLGFTPGTLSPPVGLSIISNLTIYNP